LGLPEDHILVRFFVIFACLSYLCCAVAMTLLNKYILSEKKFSNPNLLVFWQNLVTVILMFIRKWRGTANFSWDTRVALKWLPCNILFVLMLSTSGFAL
jgi:hypothetical protein